MDNNKKSWTWSRF